MSDTNGAGIVAMAPRELPPPAGSLWEELTPGTWQLVRLAPVWRDSVRSLTAARSLEVGVSTWRLTSNSPFLEFGGNWRSRRADMRRLEVWVDGRRVTDQELQDTVIGPDRLVLYDGQGSTKHEVTIHFPATANLSLISVGVAEGATVDSVADTEIRWCSWGDSITQGTVCPCGRDSYVQRAAMDLGWVAVNRGFGGAGFPDPATALAVACGAPWDILTVALGTNSALNGQETAAEFGRMYRLCLEILAERCPHKPIVCLSPVPCLRESTDAVEAVGERIAEIAFAIRQAVNDLRSPNVSLVDGLELLSEAQGISPDMVHPNEWGHGTIAERLAPILSNRFGGTNA